VQLEGGEEPRPIVDSRIAIQVHAGDLLDRDRLRGVDGRSQSVLDVFQVAAGLLGGTVEQALRLRSPG
jgi:hypothetical protein